MAVPTKNITNDCSIQNNSPTPISLTQRAPTGPIPTRTWHMYLRGVLEYKNHLEQRNQCIRSRVSHLYHTTFGWTVRIGRTQLGRGVASFENSFPYPAAYQSKTQMREPRCVQEHNEHYEHIERPWGFTNSWFGITRTSAIDSENMMVQPVYVVIGIFRRGCSNPRERVVFINNPKRLFWGISWATFRLRD